MDQAPITSTISSWVIQSLGCFGARSKTLTSRTSRTPAAKLSEFSRSEFSFYPYVCSNLKTRTSRTKLSDFFFVRTIEFLLCARRKLGHVGTQKSGLLGRKGPNFLYVQITEFLSFFEKRNSVSSFYFPITYYN